MYSLAVWPTSPASRFARGSATAVSDAAGPRPAMASRTPVTRAPAAAAVSAAPAAPQPHDSAKAAPAKPAATPVPGTIEPVRDEQRAQQHAEDQRRREQPAVARDGAPRRAADQAGDGDGRPRAGQAGERGQRDAAQDELEHHRCDHDACEQGGHGRAVEPDRRLGPARQPVEAVEPGQLARDAQLPAEPGQGGQRPRHRDGGRHERRTRGGAPRRDRRQAESRRGALAGTPAKPYEHGDGAGPREQRGGELGRRRVHAGQRDHDQHGGDQAGRPHPRQRRGGGPRRPRRQHGRQPARPAAAGEARGQPA